MTVELWIALIAGAVALISAVVTVYGQVWQFNIQQRSRKLDEATVLLSKYRDPLARAAFDLQSRLYNIVRGSFIDVYYLKGSEVEREYAETSTLWVLGQFLGWTEILRREVQFLDLGSVKKNQTLQTLLLIISKVLATDREGIASTFRVFRADQRAIGEVMITERRIAEGSLRSDCLGYAEFSERMKSETFSRWFGSFKRDIHEIAKTPVDARLTKLQRIVLLQRALVDLIDFMDEDRSRFDLDERGKLPGELIQRSSMAEIEQERLEAQKLFPSARVRCARFYFTGDPWPTVEEWARQDAYTRTNMRLTNGSSSEFEKHFGPWNGKSRVCVIYDNGLLQIFSWIQSPAWSRAIRVPLEVPLDTRGRYLSTLRKDAKRSTNNLLQRFDRPTIQ